MGVPASDKLAEAEEKPQRLAQLEHGFYLGRTTVSALGSQLIGQPMVLIEANPCRKGQIRADAHEHACQCRSQR